MNETIFLELTLIFEKGSISVPFTVDLNVTLKGGQVNIAAVPPNVRFDIPAQVGRCQSITITEPL